jgi:hypothetical protein
MASSHVAAGVAVKVSGPAPLVPQSHPQHRRAVINVQVSSHLGKQHLQHSSFLKSQRSSFNNKPPHLVWRGGRGPKRRPEYFSRASSLPVHASQSAGNSRQGSGRNDNPGEEEKPQIWELMLKRFFGGAQGKMGEKVMASLLKTTSAPIGIYVSEPLTALHRLDPRVKQVRFSL